LAFHVDACDAHVRAGVGGDEQAMHGGYVVLPPRLLPDCDGQRGSRDDVDQDGQLAPLVQIEHGERAGEPGVDADEPDHPTHAT
jgi:hypothetical protein